MSVIDPNQRDEIVAAITQRLVARKFSAFQSVGDSRCRAQVEASLAALEQDLTNGRRDAVREAVPHALDTWVPAGLTFSDLRYFSTLLREHVHTAVAAERRLEVEDWFFEHFSVSTMNFMVKRDDAMQRRIAQQEVERFEHQLEELKLALADKTKLLETIRQASTPIAPVVDGILVVPLVGLFDGVRAQALTERLLEEVSRVRAHAAIIDISGVPVFDTDAAQLIIRLSRSVRLLGAEVFLVGMSAENARTIVNLGIDLSSLETTGSLQAGLANALAVQGLEIVRMRARAGKRPRDT